MYCGQTLEWINMILGMRVGLVPGHTVLVPPTERDTAAPTFEVYGRTLCITTQA